MLQRLFDRLIGSADTEHRRPSLDRKLEELDNHLDNLDTLIQPAPESSPRTPFDTTLPKEQITTFNFTPRQMVKVFPIILPLLRIMQSSAGMYDVAFQPSRREASPDFIAELEGLAHSAGAKGVKYVRVPRRAIFRDKGIPHGYAVLFTVEMDAGPIDTAPSFECMREVMRGYKNLALISNKLARFMRKNGFAAYPGTALGGLTDYDYLAELAGLGAIGYHGLLITPGQGPRLRINTIYTNIENLPSIPGTTIFGFVTSVQCARSAFASAR